MEKFTPTSPRTERTSDSKLKRVLQKAKNVGLTGLAFLAFNHAVQAQESGTLSKIKSGTETGSAKHEGAALNAEAINLGDTAAMNAKVLEIYNKNKQQNDKNFRGAFSPEGLPDTESVFVNYEGPDSITLIKVKFFDSAGKLLSRNVYHTVDELAGAHPELQKIIQDYYHKTYNEYVSSYGWAQILSEREKTLSDNFEGYVPSAEEIAILKNAAELKNSGGTTDGYDDIYHHLVDTFKTPADRYAFYQKYNVDPGSLAHYLVGKYYTPLLKK